MLAAWNVRVSPLRSLVGELLSGMQRGDSHKQPPLSPNVMLNSASPSISLVMDMEFGAAMSGAACDITAAAAKGSITKRAVARTQCVHRESCCPSCYVLLRSSIPTARVCTSTRRSVEHAAGREPGPHASFFPHGAREDRHHKRVSRCRSTFCRLGRDTVREIRMARILSA